MTFMSNVGPHHFQDLINDESVDQGLHKTYVYILNHIALLVHKSLCVYCAKYHKSCII